MISKNNAAAYIKKFGERKDMHLLKKQLREYVEQRNDINKKIIEIVEPDRRYE